MVSGLYKNECVRLPDFSNILPPDAVVLGVQYDFLRGSFLFKIYSNTFEIVRQFAQIPEMNLGINYQYRIIKLPKDAAKIE